MVFYRSGTRVSFQENFGSIFLVEITFLKIIFPEIFLGHNTTPSERQPGRSLH